MRIALVSRDSRDLYKHEFIRDYIEKYIPVTTFRIFCGEPDKRRHEPRRNVVYQYEEFNEFLESHKNVSDGNLAEFLASTADSVPSSLYRADRRFVLHQVEEHVLALEQLYLVDFMKKRLEDFKPHIMFMTGGGNLVRNVPFFVGEQLGVHCYRVLNASYLNPQRKGMRYWFNANNYCRISLHNYDKFSYDEEKVMNHVKELVSSIASSEYNLDEYARSVASKNRVSPSLKEALNDLRKSVFLKKNTIRKSHPSWKRLISFKNKMLNNKLASTVERIHKPFFIFPLNVPEDAQLVLRAPRYRDILSICEQIANILPYGHVLAIKEHPGHPGMLDHSRLKSVLRCHSNMVYITADVQLRDLFPYTSGLITINSTAGFEALAKGLPVITIGDCFYRGTGITYDTEFLNNIEKALDDALLDPLKETRIENLKHLLRNLLFETVPAPGEVIEPIDDNNLSIIAQGVLTRIKSSVH